MNQSQIYRISKIPIGVKTEVRSYKALWEKVNATLKNTPSKCINYLKTVGCVLA